MTVKEMAGILNKNVFKIEGKLTYQPEFQSKK